MKMKRTLCLTLLLIFAFGTMAFAASNDMGNNGRAYLNVGHANGYRNVDAGTTKYVSSDYTSLKVITAYQDGNVYTYNTGRQSYSTTYNSSWEDALDYSSVHNLYHVNHAEPYESVPLSED